MMFVCVVAQLAIGGEEQEVKPSKVKGSFLLFDEGSVPKTDVKVYSAFVRKPASYNSAEALDVIKTMMNVKVGKEHGIFTLCVDDPAMGSLMGYVYFHERQRPLMDVSLQLNKLNKADADYELPPLKEGQVMSGGDHPAQCAAAKEAEEWLAVRPLSRKEREARLRQQQAEKCIEPAGGLFWWKRPVLNHKRRTSAVPGTKNKACHALAPALVHRPISQKRTGRATVQRKLSHRLVIFWAKMTKNLEKARFAT